MTTPYTITVSRPGTEIPPVDVRPVMTPLAYVNLDGVQVPARVARHRCVKSMMESCGTAEVVLAEPTGLLATLSDTLAEKLSPPAGTTPTLVQFELVLGYRGWGAWSVYTGWVQRAEPLDKRTLTLKLDAVDDLPLRQTRITEATLESDPQTAVAGLLARAGIARTYISLYSAKAIPDDPYNRTTAQPCAPLKRQVIRNKSVLEVLEELKGTLKIPYCWRFDAAAKFVWSPWVDGADEAASPNPVFQYRRNIVKLTPPSGDRADYRDLRDPYLPAGAVFGLEAIPQPWLQAGQVAFLDHPRSIWKRMRCDSIEHTGGRNRTRSEIPLRGVS